MPTFSARPFEMFEGAAHHVVGFCKEPHDGAKIVGIPLTEIAEMVSANPAKAVGIFEKTGSIAIGKAADLVLLDGELNVIEAYVDGICYRKD